MNIFRLSGDLLHLASILILLLKIYSHKNCRGISLKTQGLYLVVFLTRYVDLLYNFTSMYNWIMKIIFIASAGAIVYLMKFKRPISDTYDAKADGFNVLYLILPSALLALVINEYFSFTEILWTFSLYLEAVAIVPQLMTIHEKAKESRGFVEVLTSHYVFALGGYRFMYLLNWIYRYFTEDDYRNWIVWLSGMVQSAIYCDFFYYYIKAQLAGQKMSLPV